MGQKNRPRVPLFAVIVVDDDGEMVVGDEGLQLGSEFLDEGGVVVDGEVGDDIDRYATLVLKVVEAVDLLDAPEAEGMLAVGRTL